MNLGGKCPLSQRRSAPEETDCIQNELKHSVTICIQAVVVVSPANQLVFNTYVNSIHQLADFQKFACIGMSFL